MNNKPSIAEDPINPADYFYDSMAESYDTMTGDASRWSQVVEIYTSILAHQRPNLVLDVGCGTGGEAIMLAKCGARVIGVDASREFISIARKKAESVGVKVDFHIDDIRKLNLVKDNTSGLIICRGNTLPHLLTESDLRMAIKTLRRVAEKGALLILQWLNYVPVLKQKKRMVGSSGNSSDAFVRFYDFEPDGRLVFNILHLKYNNNWQAKWNSTRLMPWSVDDVGMLLRQSGWGNLEVCSDMQRSEFFPEESRDALIYTIAE